MAKQTPNRIPGGPIETFETSLESLYAKADAFEDPDKVRAARETIDSFYGPARRLAEIDEWWMRDEGNVAAISIPSAEGVMTYRGMFPDDFPEEHKDHVRRLLQRAIGAPEVGTPEPGDLM